MGGALFFLQENEARRTSETSHLLLLSSGLSPFVNKDGLREPAPGVFGMKRKAQRELENGTETSVTDDQRPAGSSL